MKTWVKFVMLLSLTAALGWADVKTDIWNDAVAAAENCRYDDALKGFWRLADEGVMCPELYQNLAACYQRSGETGKALACLEFAVRLQPSEETYHAMINGLLRSLDRQSIRPTQGGWRDAVFFWTDLISPGLLVIWGLLLWFTAWGIQLLRLWYPRRALTLSAAILLLLACYAGAGWWHRTHPLPVGITIRTETPIFFGKNADDVPRFILSEGERIAITILDDPWSKICTADGKTGWCQTDSIAVVSDTLRMPRVDTLEPDV